MADEPEQVTLNCQEDVVGVCENHRPRPCVDCSKLICSACRKTAEDFRPSSSGPTRGQLRTALKMRLIRVKLPETAMQAIIACKDCRTKSDKENKQNEDEPSGPTSLSDTREDSKAPAPAKPSIPVPTHDCICAPELHDTAWRCLRCAFDAEQKMFDKWDLLAQARGVTFRCMICNSNKKRATAEEIVALGTCQWCGGRMHEWNFEKESLQKPKKKKKNRYW